MAPPLGGPLDGKHMWWKYGDPASNCWEAIGSTVLVHTYTHFMLCDLDNWAKVIQPALNLRTCPNPSGEARTWKFGQTLQPHISIFVFKEEENWEKKYFGRKTNEFYMLCDLENWAKVTNLVRDLDGKHMWCKYGGPASNCWEAIGSTVLVHTLCSVTLRIGPRSSNLP